MDISVLRSIKPYWLYLILIGKKTVEIAKTAPKLENWNRKVFLYCSKDKKSFNRIPAEHREIMSKYIGKIACEFLCDEIEDYSKWSYDYPSLLRHINLGAGTNSDYKFLDSYLSNKTGYGWHISDLVIYDKPRELNEFKPYCDARCIDGKYCKYNEYIEIYNSDTCTQPRTITKPPQSWCYAIKQESNKLYKL